MKITDVMSQNLKMLKNMEGWLDKATKHAEHKKFEVDTLMKARLAPDQFAFDRQVQSACDAAKFAAAYLSGTQAPAHEDNEKTIADLRARIRKCMQFIESVKPDAYANGDTAKVAPKWAQGRWMTGHDYLVQLAIPNFYFHVTTAYSILRHNGVDVGKMDFTGPLPFKE